MEVAFRASPNFPLSDYIPFLAYRVPPIHIHLQNAAPPPERQLDGGSGPRPPGGHGHWVLRATTVGPALHLFFFFLTLDLT